VVLESSGPGVTWDALGVIGVGNKSFTQYNQKHLAAQVAHRRPDLIVIMLGGNELGFPVLQSGDAAAYTELARGTLRMLRAGAPTAGCLIVTPLDQGEREGETIRTKKGLKRAIASQRQVAAEEGCAFWDAWAAMGGEGAVSRWMRHRPALAWADLVHLSGAGQDIIGQLLADAIEAGYGDWKSTGGSKR
jgi:lysophospholipase L1-like esterase